MLPKNHFRLSILAGIGFATIFSGCITGQDSKVTNDEALLRQSGQTAFSPTSQGAGIIKVDICHIPPGNPGNAHIITVGSPAYDAHMAHGDMACADTNIPTEDEVIPGDSVEVEEPGS